MLILQGLFGLGFSELVVVVVAILLILGPKNIALVKPLIKSVYKAWLSYQREVYKAQGDMQEMKESVMEPIKEAEREAEMEFRQTQKEFSATTDEFGKAMGTQTAPRIAGLRQKRFQAAQQITAGQQPAAMARNPPQIPVQGQAMQAPKPELESEKTPQPLKPRPEKQEAKKTPEPKTPPQKKPAKKAEAKKAKKKRGSA